jgi:hypothetical protein
MNGSPRVFVGLIATLALAGCSKEEPKLKSGQLEAKPTETVPAAPGATAPEPAMPPGATASRPPSGAQGSGGDEDGVGGTVVETMNSGGYTYAKVDDGKRQVWLAGPETMVVVGAKVAKVKGSAMPGFHSDTLNRTFDQIYFVNSLTVTGGAMPNPHGAAGSNSQVTEKIAPPAGGTTVEAVFANKATLVGKTVVVRGKIIKVNNGILGRNWLHLQDGTGAPGSNDLIVTTEDTVNKDDVVVVRGKVSTNKDFGAGYKYAVLVEDASVAAK